MRYIALVVLASALFGCGGVRGDEDATDAVEVDSVEADSPVDPGVEDVAGDDPAPDPEAEDVEEEGDPECTPGPPVTFADGVAWSRELHVGAGRDYPTLFDAASTALPGDRIVVHSGTYGGEFISGLQGTETQPVAIVAATGEAPPVFNGPGTGIQLSDPAWVLVEGITVEDCADNGLNIDDGGDYSTPAGPIVIRSVTVRDIGPSGNRDGIKMSGVDGFVVYGCTVERWGDGGSAVDMVGCHDGLIAGNTFEHLPGTTGATGVQAKGGSRDVEIRGNLFLDAGGRAVNMGGSTGDEYFRPLGIGYEASGIDVIANVFVGGQAPAAFVGCEDACLFAHNTVWLPDRWFLRILNERPDILPLTRDGRVLFNIVVVDSGLATFVNIGPDTDPASFTFDGNLWFDVDDPGFAMEDVPNDAGATLAQTNAIVDDPLLEDPAAGDFSLEAGSPAAGAAGDLAERTLDFEEKCYADPAGLGAVEVSP